MNASNRPITTVALLILFGVVAFAGSRSAQSPSSVVVTNTTSQPVPVALQGTPNVRSLQGGTWSVYLLGSPTLRINNAVTAPIPVHENDEPGRNAWGTFVQMQISDGAFEKDDESLINNTAKRLIITHVSVGEGGTNPGSFVRVMSMKNDQGLTSVLIGLTPVPSSDSTKIGNEQTFIPVDPGAHLFIRADRLNSAGIAYVQVNLQGYWVSP